MSYATSTADQLAQDSANYETNGITPELHAFRDAIDYSRRVQLNDKNLDKIIRIRVFTPSQEEIRSGLNQNECQYAWGVMKDGEKVSVIVPLRLQGGNVKAAIVAMCQAEGVYGKALGIFDYGVISTLRG